MTQRIELSKLLEALETVGIEVVTDDPKPHHLTANFITPTETVLALKPFNDRISKPILRNWRLEGWLKEGKHWKNIATPGQQPRHAYCPRAIAQLMETPRNQWKNYRSDSLRIEDGAESI